MNCPKCKSKKVHIMDVVHNTAEDEIYRKKKCANCGFSYFTVEFEAVENARFKKEWNKYHRKGTYPKDEPSTSTCMFCGSHIPGGGTICNTCLLNGAGVRE